MNNGFVIATLSFAAGALLGFFVGSQLNKEKDEENSRVWSGQIKKEKKEAEKKPSGENQPKVVNAEEVFKHHEEIQHPEDDDPEQRAPFVSGGPAKIPTPEKPGVDYSKVARIVKENGYSDPEDIQKVIDDPENSETYEEFCNRIAENAKKKFKIVPISKEEWEQAFEDDGLDKLDLYYFTADNVLTDDEGNVVDELEYIGSKPRQFGWMDNDEDEIFIFNEAKDVYYHVWKERCSSVEWW